MILQCNKIEFKQIISKRFIAMKKKFLFRCLYILALLNISNGISTLDPNQDRPFWDSFHPCAIELPSVHFCDVDYILNEDEIKILHSSMKSCSEQMTAKAYDIQVKMFAFEHIRIEGNVTLTGIDQLLGYLTSHWSAFLSDPVYMVIAVKESDEVREWVSESAMSTGYLELQQQPGQSLQEQLGSPGQNFITTLTKTQEIICTMIESWYSPTEFSLSSILWIILSTIIITGSFTFGCWIYRFNKSHPTTEGPDVYEMNQDILYDEDGNPLYGSGFVLSQNEIEAASPDPAKTTTHEALDRI